MPEGLRYDVEDWLEWEETILRPAVGRGNPAALQAALERLAKAVSAGQYLVGNVVTLADIAVYSTLLPLSQAGQVSAKRSQHQAGYHGSYSQRASAKAATAKAAVSIS